MKVDKDQIQVISGGQQGLDIISKTLISQGDCIFVEIKVLEIISNPC